MMEKQNRQLQLIGQLAQSDVSKCMKCGKCTASCPAGPMMDLLPHQIVSCLQNGQIETVLASATLQNCASCFTCMERCPRGVKPGKLIEACRLSVIRMQGQSYLSPDQVPELLTPDLPPQLLAGAFRKYRK